MAGMALTPGRAAGPPVGRTKAAPDPPLADAEAALPVTLLDEPTFMFLTPLITGLIPTLTCLLCRMVNAGQILPQTMPAQLSTYCF
jgi:hypothetical protein